MNAVEPVTEIIKTEPYYAAQGDEVTIFEAAWRNQLPVLLKGPTGCGKPASWNIWRGAFIARLSLSPVMMT